MRNKLETLQSLDLCFTIIEKLNDWHEPAVCPKEFRELAESCSLVIQMQIKSLTKDIKSMLRS